MIISEKPDPVTHPIFGALPLSLKEMPVGWHIKNADGQLVADVRNGRAAKLLACVPEMIAALEAVDVAEKMRPTNSAELWDWRQLHERAKALLAVALAKMREVGA